jgi:drug/metabolite transporter (DMT)-like permease
VDGWAQAMIRLAQPVHGFCRNCKPLTREGRVTATEEPNKKRSVLSVLAAMFLWSTSYVVTKVGVTDMTPLVFGAIRFLAASMLCLAVLPFKRPERVAARDMLKLGAGGLLGITALFSLQNLGMRLATSADATLIVAAFPAITVVLELIFFGGRPSLRRLIGVCAAFAGVYLIIQNMSGAPGPHRVAGDLLLLASGLAWALYNFITQDVVRKYSTFTVIFWQTIVGTIACLPLAVIESRSSQPLTGAALACAAYLGGFCSVGAFLLYGFGLKSLAPVSAVCFLNLVPVFGVVFSVLLLGERLSLVQLAGGLVVLAGVTLTLSRARSPEGSRRPQYGDLSTKERRMRRQGQSIEPNQEQERA